MKSKQEQLLNRGYLPEKEESKYLQLSFDERIKLLRSKISTERTLGARLLAISKDKRAIEHLMYAIKHEKKLYSKIEVCNSLVSFGQLSIKPLTTLLGEIGANQHKSLPEKGFKKSNYPLPRDIASRTLARIGKSALPELIRTLNAENEQQLSEAIDAIGFICFYDYQPEIYSSLKDCFSKYNTNNLIKWKVIRAMSGFPESESFLQEQRQLIQVERIHIEIERSLLMIKKRIESQTVTLAKIA